MVDLCQDSGFCGATLSPSTCAGQLWRLGRAIKHQVFLGPLERLDVGFRKSGKSLDLLKSDVVCFHKIMYHHGSDLRNIFFQLSWAKVAGTGEGCYLQSH